MSLGTGILIGFTIGYIIGFGIKRLQQIDESRRCHSYPPAIKVDKKLLKDN